MFPDIFYRTKANVKKFTSESKQSLVYSWRKLLPLNNFKNLTPSKLAVSTSTEKVARLTSIQTITHSLWKKF